MKGYEREFLKQIEKKVLNILKQKQYNYISKIYGIGSFYRFRKQRPNDIDFAIEIYKPFQQIINLKSFKKFIDKLEELKDETRKQSKDGEPLFNLFIIDKNEKILNSVDFWFIIHKNESLEKNLETRKGYYYITNKFLLYEQR